MKQKVPRSIRGQVNMSCRFISIFFYSDAVAINGCALCSVHRRSTTRLYDSPFVHLDPPHLIYLSKHQVSIRPGGGMVNAAALV
jgi:hypothetical protein